MLEAIIDLNQARNHIVGMLVPEIGAMQRKSFNEHLRARAEGRLSPVKVSSKNDRTFETTNNDDLTVDQLIHMRLYKAYPQIPHYLSEDSPDPKLRGLDPDDLRKFPGLWVVDAKDGTGRYENFSPEFSNSIAFVSFGRTLLAVIHKPIEGSTWWAQADQEGAYKDGQRIFVSDTAKLRESMLTIPYSWDLDERRETHNFNGYLLDKVHQPGINRASSVWDILEVAEGKIAGAYGRGLRYWDIAAVSFIIEKAGGRFTRYNGEQGDSFVNDFLMTNGKIHDELIEEARGFEESKGSRMQNPRGRLRDLLSMPVHALGDKVRPVIEATRSARKVARLAIAVPAMILNILAHGFGRSLDR